MAEEKVQMLGRITGVHQCRSVQEGGHIFTRVPAPDQSAPTFRWRRRKGNTEGYLGPKIARWQFQPVCPRVSQAAQARPVCL